MQQEDWDELRDQMDSPYGRMSLQCDQFKVSLVQVIDTKARKWATEVFVDGTQKMCVVHERSGWRAAARRAASIPSQD